MLLEAVDAIFDGVGAEKFVHEDGLGLADAVGAVGRLCFGGGVPPRVVVNDGVGGSEVQSGATRFEGDEENGDIAVLKFIDEAAAVLRGTGEFEVGGFAGDEFVLDELQQSLLLENLLKITRMRSDSILERHAALQGSKCPCSFLRDSI